VTVKNEASKHACTFMVTLAYIIRRRSDEPVLSGEIKRLTDSKTKLILINSPQNPTGATISDDKMEALHEFTAERGIQLVSDEVYHPIYHGRQTRSAARLPHATVIADLSKALSIAGVRTGWMIEHDAQRRQQYWTARAYFSISNTTTERFFRRSQFANATPCSARLRKSPPETSSCSRASWRTIATYSAGFRRKAA
jgi:histidinol-phosphate/aromatic aminotransferase/cobyric acid decarboxylase-like protein